jgi:hypothetical protein
MTKIIVVEKTGSITNKKIELTKLNGGQSGVGSGSGSELFDNDELKTLWRASGKKTAVPSSFGIKHVFTKSSVPDSHKKQCGLLDNVSGKTEYLVVVANDNGKAGKENKYELPPPVDNAIYYDSFLIVKLLGESSSADFTVVDLKKDGKDGWSNMYECLFGGFDDCEGDEEGGDIGSESENEEMEAVAQAEIGGKLTKDGYLMDGFVVSDGSDEFGELESDEEYYFSDED